MRVHKSTCAHKDAPKERMKNEWNKWKGMEGCHFMKEKGTRRCLHQDTKSLITPSLELIIPSFFPFYLSSSPSDLHIPPFFQSTRREIGSETTDNLSEDNPVKNVYRASAHALILTHPYIFVSSKTTTYIFMQAIGYQDVVLFALPNAFITNKQTTC